MVTQNNFSSINYYPSYPLTKNHAPFESHRLTQIIPAEYKNHNEFLALLILLVKNF